MFLFSPRVFHQLRVYVRPFVNSSVYTTPFRPFSRFTAEEEGVFREIEAWFDQFKRTDIPVDSFDKNFSRSSGPGGQNVNKVNTKAEFRFSLSKASWIHEKVRERIRSLYPRYLVDKDFFVVTSEQHRTQKQNIDECVLKIYDCIKDASKVPKATSEEQKAKIKKLESASNERRLREKQFQKDKKGSRSGSGKYD